MGILKRLSVGLTRLSPGWAALIALAIFVMFTILVLPGQAQRAETASAGAETPDLSLFYSPGDLYRMAEAYGSSGRQEYVRLRFTFDLVWPLVYTLFLVTAVSWVFARAFSAGSPWRLANLAPLAGFLMDLFENLATSLVMLRYPSRTPGVDFLAPCFTFTKWSLLGASFVLLIGGLIAWGWKRLQTKPTA